MTWECKEGCSECCGLITFPSRLVYDNVSMMQVKPTHKKTIPHDFAGHQEEVFFITEDYKCVFLNRTTNKCMIYDVRPDVCRKFGRIAKLLCPYIDMTGTPRTPAQVKHVQRFNDRNTEKKLKEAKARYDERRQEKTP